MAKVVRQTVYAWFVKHPNRVVTINELEEAIPSLKREQLTYATRELKNDGLLECKVSGFYVLWDDAAKKTKRTHPFASEETKEAKRMGMFEKDKEFGLRLDQSFELGEQFIVWGAHISEKKLDTKVGDGTIAVITCSPMGDPGDRLDYNTIASAIVEKVKLAQETDFPAVCELRRVKGRFRDDALVLQFIKEYQ